MACWANRRPCRCPWHPHRYCGNCHQAVCGVARRGSRVTYHLTGGAFLAATEPRQFSYCSFRLNWGGAEPLSTLLDGSAAGKGAARPGRSSGDPKLGRAGTPVPRFNRCVTRRCISNGVLLGTTLAHHWRVNRLAPRLLVNADFFPTGKPTSSQGLRRHRTPGSKNTCRKTVALARA